MDTDAVVLEGLLCVSRTFPVGTPSAQQRELHAASLEWLRAMKDVVRPGITCAEIAERGPRLPTRYLEQRYEVMITASGSRRRAQASPIPAIRSRTPSE